jgi:hypothetical protein
MYISWRWWLAWYLEISNLSISFSGMGFKMEVPMNDSMV